jgi:hypothetical protein
MGGKPAQRGDDERLDRFAGGTACCKPRRRGPLTVRACITWVGGAEGAALASAQGRVLREVLVALTARRRGVGGEDDGEAG